MGIDIVLSARYNAVQDVIKNISEDSVNIFALFEKGKAVISEVCVVKSFAPVRLMDINLPNGTIIAAIRRGGRTIVPSGTDKIKGGDLLRVFQAEDAEGSIEETIAAIHANNTKNS